jgi:dTDP-4-amino-4,6-dideoxygalactose transaminase
MIGNLGACEVLSFHATKFLHSLEGGAVVTTDDRLADKMRLMRNFGFAGFDNVIYPGTNGKLTEISAAMGLTNLEYIDQLIEKNKRNYSKYRDGVSDIIGLRLLEYDESERNNYQYVVFELTPDFPVPRDEIVRVLHAENVLVRKYFWPGCHNMMPYRAFYPHAGLLLPNTATVANRVIVLPTGGSISEEHIEAILQIFRVLSDSRKLNVVVNQCSYRR